MTDLIYIVRVGVTTVCVLSVMIVGTFLFGLFFNQVDNKMIFEVLGPMSHEIVGALLMLIGGISSYYLTKPTDDTK